MSLAFTRYKKEITRPSLYEYVLSIQDIWFTEN